MRIGLPGLGDRSFKVEGDVFPMSATKLLNTFALCLAVVAIGLVGFKNYQGDQNGQLLNVSYDPAREVYKEINSKFIAKYQAEAGHQLRVEQSHGGSSRQARAVAEGLAADVVTLALPSDIEGLSNGPYARFIPKSALAGLLFITAARLIDWKRLGYAIRASRFDSILVFVTAFAAIFISVEDSILIGVAIYSSESTTVNVFSTIPFAYD
jgi:hypothetical protein